MASIATVVTMGYGSFGSVNVLPTLGYGIGAEPVDLTTPAGIFRSLEPGRVFESSEPGRVFESLEPGRVF